MNASTPPTPENVAETTTVRELVDQVGLPPDTSLLYAMPSLSARLYGALRRDQIATLGDLARHEDVELLDIRNFGPGMLAELKRQLAEAVQVGMDGVA